MIEKLLMHGGGKGFAQNNAVSQGRAEETGDRPVM